MRRLKGLLIDNNASYQPYQIYFKGLILFYLTAYLAALGHLFSVCVIDRLMKCRGLLSDHF